MKDMFSNMEVTFFTVYGDTTHKSTTVVQDTLALPEICAGFLTALHDAGFDYLTEVKVFTENGSEFNSRPVKKGSF